MGIAAWNYDFSSAVRTCTGHYIKINICKDDGDETTTEDIHGYNYSHEGCSWYKKCAEEIKWIDNLDKNEIQGEKI